ncbi:hypothetical protein [Ralstonia pseudosolanacearum]|uniref:hypothetical protein n=1 Tax=Ralstonia pseudosolanacearum TaxID=1310165 RepID=UPI00386FE432
MTVRESHIQDRLDKAAKTVGAILDDTAAMLSSKIHLLKEEIRRIESLSFMSEEEERDQALRPTRRRVREMEAHLEQVKGRSRFGMWGVPVQALNGFRELRRAEADHAAVISAFDAPDEQDRRTKQITDHNQAVREEQDSLASLRTSLATAEFRHATIVRFRRDAADAISAAKGDGWIAPDFVDRFCAMSQDIVAGNVDAAFAYLPRLLFQRRPSEAAYDQWTSEAASVRDGAYKEYIGMAVSGAYPEVVLRSIALAHRALRKEPSQVLGSYLHAADQWQVLSALVADPRQFKVDALWSVYWSMFQCGQSVAETLSEATAHEDVLNGDLTAQINRWLGDWGTKRLRQFGYPEAASYMGMLKIASTNEETRLGADLGLIVDLDIGGLVCRKVALFQAKKAKQGIANVGSSSGQLPILAARPKTGFYLFYHLSQYPLRSPAPTVCSAQTLVDCVTQDGKQIDAAHLPVNIRPLGCDWASFVSFGLCQPTSGLGEEFGTIDEALTLLGEGNQGHLPKYLHVIAIADEPRVMQLRRKVHEHYLDALAKQKEMDHARPRKKPREMDGPEHGHGMGL